MAANQVYAQTLTPAQGNARLFLERVPRPINQNMTQQYVMNPPQKHYKITVHGIQGQTSDFVLEIQAVFLQIGMVCWGKYATKMEAVSDSETKCDLAVAYFHGLEMNGVVLSALKSEFFLEDENNTGSDTDETDEENELSD